ncbi:MAG: aspartyl protease family protein [Candidatus Methanospirareceae archaeon]
MGHVHVNACIKNEKAELVLKEILVDTGATYTVLSLKRVEEVGAVRIPPYEMDVELGDGRTVRASIYAASIKIEDREGPAIILAFEGAKEVIGVQTLESLGLKVDTSTNRLEPTRPRGIAYFYAVLAVATMKKRG